MIFKKINYKILILLMIPLIWVIIWFRSGLMIAGAEEGMPFYSPTITKNLYQYTWVDMGLGVINPNYLPRFPLYLISDFFYKIGISSYIFEAIFFYICNSIRGAHVIYYILKNNEVAISN